MTSIDKVQRELAAINKETDEDGRLAHIGDIARQVIDNLRIKQSDPDKYGPIPTGLTKLDAIIHGVSEGQYICIGGKAKIGKTSFLLHTAMAVAASGRGKVHYYTLEELQEAMGIRTMTMLSTKTNRDMIKTLMLTEYNFEDLERQCEILKDIDLFVDDGVTEGDMIIAKAIEEDAAFVFIDYMQLMTEMAAKEQNFQMWDTISRKFVKARNRTGITFVIAYQIGDNNKAYGTRSLYRDADLIIEVEKAMDYITKEEIPGELILHVQRSRIAQEDSCSVAFSGVHGRLFNHADLNDMLEESMTTPEPPEGYNQYEFDAAPE